MVCEADDNCGEYVASGTTPCHPCSTAPSDSSRTTTPAQLSTFQMQKPPDLSMVQKDATTLNFFSNLLRKWSRIGGYSLKDQGDVFAIHAAANCPTLAMEMDKKIGDKLSEAPDAVEQIIQWLEDRYGVDRQVDICKTFKKFFFSTRTSGTDLVTYINEFEMNFAQLQKLGEIQISELYLALFLFMNARLNNVEFSILYNKLDFEKAMTSKDKTILERTKAILRRSQYGRELNSGTNSPNVSSGVPSNSSRDGATGSSGALPKLNILSGSSSNDAKSITFAIDEEIEFDDETTDQIKDLVETFVSGKKEEWKSKKVYKCKYCICSCPRDLKCNCSCTKHPFWQCKYKNKEKKGAKKDTEGSDTDEEPVPKVDKPYVNYLSQLSEVLSSKTF